MGISLSFQGLYELLICAFTSEVFFFGLHLSPRTSFTSDLHNGVFSMVNSYSFYSSLTALKTFLMNEIIGSSV